MLVPLKLPSKTFLKGIYLIICQFDIPDDSTVDITELCFSDSSKKGIITRIL